MPRSGETKAGCASTRIRGFGGDSTRPPLSGEEKRKSMIHSSRVSIGDEMRKKETPYGEQVGLWRACRSRRGRPGRQAPQTHMAFSRRRPEVRRGRMKNHTGIRSTRSSSEAKEIGVPRAGS